MARRAELELRELLRRELVGESAEDNESEASDEDSRSYWQMLGLRIMENLHVLASRPRGRT